VKRSDLLPLTTARGQQLSVRSPTRPVINHGTEISATHGFGTLMFPRSVKVFAQQINGGHNPVVTEVQEADRKLQFTTVVSHNNDQPTTRRPNLTTQSEIMHTYYDSEGSKLHNRNAWIEQVALTTHKTPDVNSSHARSGDSVEDSIEPIYSARIKRHSEAALTTIKSQTLTSKASNVLVTITIKVATKLIT
jgi:hypothetical protein